MLLCKTLRRLRNPKDIHHHQFKVSNKQHNAFVKKEGKKNGIEEKKKNTERERENSDPSGAPISPPSALAAAAEDDNR